MITDSPIPSLQLYLSGRPNGPEIWSEVESNYSDQFNLTWRVESYAEITAYRIIYRKHLVREALGSINRFFLLCIPLVLLSNE